MHNGTQKREGSLCTSIHLRLKLNSKTNFVRLGTGSGSELGIVRFNGIVHGELNKKKKKRNEEEG